MSTDPLAAFRRTTLVVERIGSQEGLYQLTDDSVSPTRIIGRDKYGAPIEETICTLARHRRFVDLEGNICDVPLRTGRVLSMEPEAIRYEMVTMMDLLRDGQIPLEVCPHTTEFLHYIGGPPVPPEPGEGACAGRPGAQRAEEACPHMQKIIALRRARGRARFDEQQAAHTAMSPAEAKRLLKQLGQAFAQIDGVVEEAEDDAPAPSGNNRKTAAARMRAGRGDEDETTNPNPKEK